MSKPVEKLNVYFYTLYDAACHQPHSGLTASTCASSVCRDVRGNYIDPRYITVHIVPELVGIARADSSEVEIVPRREAERMNRPDKNA